VFLSGLAMNAIRRTQQLNQRELDDITAPSASWHRDYSDTAFIYIGGLDPALSEGDVITIFSQYGEPVYVNLVRDKETGKSKGFAFLKYEDQRSCDLAVDNLSGATVRGRLLNVDHTRYKKRDDEELVNNTLGFAQMPATAKPGHSDGNDTDKEESESDPEPKRHASRRKETPLLKEEIELAKMEQLEDDEDPMRAYLIDKKKQEVEAARRKHHKHHKRTSSKERHSTRRRSRHGDKDKDKGNKDASHSRSRNKSPRSSRQHEISKRNVGQSPSRSPRPRERGGRRRRSQTPVYKT
jgi:RNA-binding motif X-linked protein 2